MKFNELKVGQKLTCCVNNMHGAYGVFYNYKQYQLDRLQSVKKEYAWSAGAVFEVQEKSKYQLASSNNKHFYLLYSTGLKWSTGVEDANWFKYFKIVNASQIWRSFK